MKRKKVVLVISVCATVVLALVLVDLWCVKKYNLDPIFFLKRKVNVENISFQSDKDKDGICDLDDIVEGARKEVANKTKYKDGYFAGGYPPDSEGVCTDVVWRAFKNAGYDFKTSIDNHIKENPEIYLNVKKQDTNIDFRRVKNQLVFFKSNALSLTTEVIPYDKENLKQWQRGDIVILGKYDHVAIISDKRRKDGVPYILHNASTYAKEEDALLRWSKKNLIIGHFRLPD